MDNPSESKLSSKEKRMLIKFIQKDLLYVSLAPNTASYRQAWSKGQVPVKSRKAEISLARNIEREILRNSCYATEGTMYTAGDRIVLDGYETWLVKRLLLDLNVSYSTVVRRIKGKVKNRKSLAIVEMKDGQTE